MLIFFLFGECGSSKIPFSESEDTSESSGVCQVQKSKHWDRGGKQCKHTMCLHVCTALSEEGI